VWSIQSQGGKGGGKGGSMRGFELAADLVPAEPVVALHTS